MEPIIRLSIIVTQLLNDAPIKYGGLNLMTAYSYENKLTLEKEAEFTDLNEISSTPSLLSTHSLNFSFV